MFSSLLMAFLRRLSPARAIVTPWPEVSLKPGTLAQFVTGDLVGDACIDDGRCVVLAGKIAADRIA
jgi:hypothetical protein